MTLTTFIPPLSELLKGSEGVIPSIKRERALRRRYDAARCLLRKARKGEGLEASIDAAQLYVRVEQLKAALAHHFETEKEASHDLKAWREAKKAVRRAAMGVL